MGKPLKEWDINIYRGVLTGYNEAFIIDQQTRDRLVSASAKNAEIIRPILRGRDIKRYKSEWAGLYIITTFPSLKIDIEQYPAIKEHLLSFGFDRLKQSGEIGARKQTNNKWYETQDQIGFWQDFKKPKIIWKRIGSVIRFSYDETGNTCLDSTCFAIGKEVKYIVGCLNSIICIKELLNNAPKTGTGDVITSVQALEPLNIPIADNGDKLKICQLVDKCILESSNIENIAIYQNEINLIIYKIYQFTEEEISFIESK